MVYLNYNALNAMELNDLRGMSTYALDLMSEDIKHATYCDLVTFHERINAVIEEHELFAYNEEN